MKLANIFKKATNSASYANVEKLEKNQLKKVVGGTETTDITIDTTTDASKTMHEMSKSIIQNIRA
jgi:hypothetical protein